MTSQNQSNPTVQRFLEKIPLNLVGYDISKKYWVINLFLWLWKVKTILTRQNFLYLAILEKKYQSLVVNENFQKQLWQYTV